MPFTYFQRRTVNPSKTKEKKEKNAQKLSFSDERATANEINDLQNSVDNSDNSQSITQLQEKIDNNTGIPDELKEGVENLSGEDMSDVKVTYNSDKPAQLEANAYASGNDIHVAPGQEKHLPHEAWHVVQQKQNRVKPTIKTDSGELINDDPTLEKEADVMSRKALQLKSNEESNLNSNSSQKEIIQKSNDATGSLDERKESWEYGKSHSHLLNDIDENMNEAAIIGQLIENFFKRSDFEYTFGSSGKFTGKGDCTVLCNEFKNICEKVFQIEGMDIGKGREGYLIVGGGKIVHNKQVTGNIDSGNHWYFDSHTWVIWKGKPIDVLFGQLGIKDHQPGIKDKLEKDGSVKYEGGSFSFWLKDGEDRFDKYTTIKDLRQRF